jgi:hypothetical protein
MPTPSTAVVRQCIGQLAVRTERDEYVGGKIHKIGRRKEIRLEVLQYNGETHHDYKPKPDFLKFIPPEGRGRRRLQRTGMWEKALHRSQGPPV